MPALARCGREGGCERSWGALDGTGALDLPAEEVVGELRSLAVRAVRPRWKTHPIGEQLKA